MQQTWHELLFAHWPIPPEQIRPHVPCRLPLDTFEGQCWLGVVPFRMSGIRAHYLPPVPGISAFPELNVRTYVTHQGKPGVYFFSLDAASRPAVWAARTFFHLPYFHARMSSENRNGTIQYSSTRWDGRAEFRGAYRPTLDPHFPSPSSLEHFLTERYCLYTVHQNQVFRCEIHHPPWLLQKAEAEFEINTMAHAAGVTLPEIPLLHFSARQDVLIWPLYPA